MIIAATPQADTKSAHSSVIRTTKPQPVRQAPVGLKRLPDAQAHGRKTRQGAA